MQFKDIVGQRDVINRLTEIIDSGRVSHAQMVLGATVDGSLQIALAYLQYLCCEHRQHFDTPLPPSRVEGEGLASRGDGEGLASRGDGEWLRADSCGNCPSCKKMAALSHPDLHLYFPNNTNSRVKKDPSCADFQGEFREFIQKYNGLGTLDDWYDHMGLENKQGTINVRDSADIISDLSLKSYEGGWKMVLVWFPEKMNEQSANELLKTFEEPLPGTLILLVAESDERILETIRSRVQIIRIKGKGIDLSEENRERFAGLLVAWLRLLFKLKMKELAAQVDRIAELGREQEKQFLLYSLDIMRGCFLKNAAGLPVNIGSGDEKFDAMFPRMVTANNIEAISNAFNDAIYAIERNAYGRIALMELSFRLSKALKKA